MNGFELPCKKMQGEKNLKLERGSQIYVVSWEQS